MPFAVSKWPYSPDPRSASFSAQGWAYGSVAPWTWVLTSPGATGAYHALVEGVIIKSREDLGYYTRWAGFATDGSGTEFTFDKNWRPNAGDQDISVDFAIAIHNISEPTLQANSSAIWPEAIQVLGPWQVVSSITGLPVPEVPNGVSLTPAIWNLENV